MFYKKITIYRKICIMKKIFIYLVSISLGFLLVLWVYDIVRTDIAPPTESSVVVYGDKEHAPVLEKMEDNKRDLPPTKPNQTTDNGYIKQQNDWFTNFKEYTTFFIVSLNSFFGMLLVAKQVFKKENKEEKQPQ